MCSTGLTSQNDIYSIMVHHSSILKYELYEEYGIDHIKSTLYYSPGNGQVEATNKTLLRIRSRMVYEKPKRWSDFLPLVLWAYRTSKRWSTQTTPFALVYGTEVVVSVDIMIILARLTLKVRSSTLTIISIM